MNSDQRRARVAAKIANYRDEVGGLRNAGLPYQVGFGLLLTILLPVLLAEILIVLFIGRDMGVFVEQRAFEPQVLRDEEVSESLRDLVPLARKFGLGDDAQRGKIIDAASYVELVELERKLRPRLNDIDEWLTKFPKEGLTDTASYFLYLGEAYEEALFLIKETES